MSAPEQDSTSREYFYSLEILRGLCTLAVFIYHASSFITSELMDSLHFGRVSRAMHALSTDAISVFFILSGFVVAHSYCTYRHKFGAVGAVPVFLFARAIRIWSLSIPVSLAAYFAVMNYAGDATWYHFEKPELLLRSLFAYSNEWNPAGWTLPFELWAYFTLPFAALTIFARPYWLKILGAVLAVTIFWLHWHFYSHVLYLVGEFAIGVAVYTLYRRFGFPMLRLPLRLAIFTAASLIVIVFAGLDAVYDINIMPARILGCLGIFLMFLNSEPMVRSMQDRRTTQSLLTLGQYSYSLYLWHFGVIEISLVYMIGHFQARTLEEMALLLFISIPLVLPFTWVSYHLIEKNARMSRILKAVAWGRAKLAPTIP